MFLQGHILSALAILVLVMNALGLAFTIHRQLRAHPKTGDDHGVPIPAHRRADQRNRERDKRVMVN